MHTIVFRIILPKHEIHHDNHTGDSKQEAHQKAVPPLLNIFRMVQVSLVLPLTYFSLYKTRMVGIQKCRSTKMHGWKNGYQLQSRFLRKEREKERTGLFHSVQVLSNDVVRGFVTQSSQIDYGIFESRAGLSFQWCAPRFSAPLK